MNAKKHGKVTMALAMIGGLAALSIAYAAISTQLNIKSNSDSEKVESAAVMFDQDGCEAYGVSAVATDSSGNSLKPTQVTGAIIKENGNDVAKCGSITIGSSNKKNDTVTIDGTVLRDYGAFAVYKLTIKNEGSSPVKLTNDPNSNSVTDFTGTTDSAIQKNITINVYSKDTCNEAEKVGVFSGDTPVKSQANYILGNDSTIWYVKVAHRAYGTEYGGSNPTDTSSGNDTEDITSGFFGFTMTPVWENV